MLELPRLRTGLSVGRAVRAALGGDASGVASAGPDRADAAPGAHVGCGALPTHGGERETARALARRNIAAFEATGADFYIINAAGCGSTLKEYHHLLHGDRHWEDRARRFSAKVRDISEYLA